jgi:hypothetical protein
MKKVAIFLDNKKRSRLSGAVKEGDHGVIVDYVYSDSESMLYAVVVLDDGQTVMASVDDIKTELEG